MIAMKQMSFFLILIFLSCGNPSASNKEKTKQDISLTEDELFDGIKIQTFLQNEKKFTNESNQLFMKAVDFYKNEKKLDSAEIYFIQSILKEPNAQAYYELGNLYMDLKDYTSTLKAYGLAEQLGFEPYSKILYNSSCVYSLMKENEMAGNYLQYALQAGYSNLDNINKDKDLDNLRNSYYFNEALKNGLKGMSNPDNLFWLQFKRLFPKLNKPVKLDPTDHSVSIDDLATISYDFEKYIAEMRDEAFSRDVSKGFYFHGLLTENDQFVAIIYSVREVYMGEDSPITYRLATFDPTGKLIDKREIAGNENLGEPVRFATINSNLSIAVDIYELEYAENPNAVGYQDNKLIGKKKIGSESYKIAGNGKIIETTKKDLASY
jgi:tetratricopeptide (TPR) repeat protein